MRDLKERMREKGGCLEWDGAISKAGYGIVNISGRTKRVHRVMWELEKGPIEAGKYIHHECGNRRCANIGHLALASPKEHVELWPRHITWRLGLALYCQRGHAFTSENTIRAADGHRRCRSCKRAWCLRRRTGAAIEVPTAGSGL